MTDIFKGATDQTVFMELVDSTTGLPKTGIVFGDVTGSYARTRGARVAITMATLASASAAHSDGGFILVDDTNQPGVYRLDVPDLAFATGVPEVVITLKATGCRTVSRSINLVDINNQVAYVPNAAAAGVGGLLTAPTTANVGTVDLLRIGGDAQSATDLKDFADAGYDPSTNKVQGVVLVDTLTTYTGNTLQTGDTFALANGSAGFVAIDTVVDAIKLKTDNLPSDPADASDIASSFTTVNTKLDTIDDFLDTEIAAIKTKTDQLTFTTANKVDSTAVLDPAARVKLDGTQPDYAPATAAALAAAKTILDKVDTGLVVDGAVYQFTANMLELAPAGGGGGGSGDATLAKQEEILTQLDVIQTKTDQIGSVGAITSLLAAAVLEPGTITSFPETLTIGDSYTDQNGRSIQIPIVDTDGNPLSSTGSLNFADASVTFTLQRSGETDSTRVITGTASFVDPPGTGTGAGAPYAVVEISSTETAKGLKKYKYSGILTFTWAGTGTDVMSFETSTVVFDN